MSGAVLPTSIERADDATAFLVVDGGDRTLPAGQVAIISALMIAVSIAAFLLG